MVIFYIVSLLKRRNKMDQTLAAVSYVQRMRYFKTLAETHSVQHF